MERWLIFLFLSPLVAAHAEEVVVAPTTEETMAVRSESADPKEEPGQPTTPEEVTPGAETPLLFNPTDTERVTEEFEAEFPVDI